MKKQLTMMFLILLLLSVFGCDSSVTEVTLKSDVVLLDSNILEDAQVDKDIYSVDTAYEDEEEVYDVGGDIVEKRDAGDDTGVEDTEIVFDIFIRDVYLEDKETDNDADRVCNNPCECKSGEVCEGGRCKCYKDTFGPYIFCCGDPECPAGNACVDMENNMDNCKGGVSDAGPSDICTPSSAKVSPTNISLTITQGDTANSQTVTVQDNCGNSLEYSASVTSGTEWISVPNNGTGAMNITFNTSHLAEGSYNGSINVLPSGYQSQVINVLLIVNPPVGTTCTDITAYKYPKYSPDISIPSQGVMNYCFTIDSDATTVQITMSSRDWWTSSHVFLSDKGNQTKDEIQSIINSGSTFNTYPNPAPWYNFDAGSNERVYVYGYPGAKGQKFYVTVYNTEPSASSFIQLYWTAY